MPILVMGGHCLFQDVYQVFVGRFCKSIALRLVVGRKFKLDPFFKGIASEVNGCEV